MSHLGLCVAWWWRLLLNINHGACLTFSSACHTGSLRSNSDVRSPTIRSPRRVYWSVFAACEELPEAIGRAYYYDDRTVVLFPNGSTRTWTINFDITWAYSIIKTFWLFLQELTRVTVLDSAAAKTCYRVQIANVGKRSVLCLHASLVFAILPKIKSATWTLEKIAAKCSLKISSGIFQLVSAALLCSLSLPVL